MNRWCEPRWTRAILSLAIFVWGCGGDSDKQSEQYSCDAPRLVESHISAAETWDGGCYEVTSFLNITAPLTINPGTLIVFRHAAGFRVQGSGALTAEGTADKPIIFTGSSSEKGAWAGLVFWNDTPLNRLHHTIVEYGGGVESHSTVGKGGIAVARSSYTAAVSIKDSVIRHNEGYGITAFSSGKFEAFENNTLEHNDAPLRISAANIGQIDASSSYTDNATDAVYITAQTVAPDSVISTLDVPYVSESITVAGDLTVEAGVELRFIEQSIFQVNDGVIRFEGTNHAGILLTGTEKQVGWWEGVYIRGSERNNNLVEYVTIEYAGRSAANSGNNPAGLAVSRSSYKAAVAVRNSVFRHNGGNGVFVHETGTLWELSSCTFTDNAAHGLSVTPRNIHNIVDAQMLADNGHDMIEVRGGNTGGDTTWRNVGAPWYVSGNVTVNSGTTTIESGTEIVFYDATSLQVHAARLLAVGSASAPILFEGSQAEAGWWDGIYIRNSSGGVSQFDHVEVRHAGKNAFHSVGRVGIGLGHGSYASCEATVTNSTVQHIGRVADNDAAGIAVHSNCTVNADICTANTIEYINGDPGCVVPEP